MTVKSMHGFLVAVTTSCIGIFPAFSADLSNSRYFEISDYYHPDQNGDFQQYSAHGFVEQGADKARKSVFILPTLSYDVDRIVYSDNKGRSFNPEDNPDLIPRSIRIAIRKHAKLPDATQIPAFAAAIAKGATVHAFQLPPMRDQAGNPMIFPPTRAHVPLVQEIHNAYQRYDQMLSKQADVIQEFANFAPELVNISGLSISVIVDNQPVTTVDYGGSFISGSNSAGYIDVVQPDEYTFNKLREGHFSIQAAYKFRDEKTGYINATFDASRIIERFLSHTQQASVESKESGWKILGIGSRRKTLRQSFNEQIDQRNTDNSVDNTVIEMFDASDDMIAQFEAKAFPEVSRTNAIDAHLAAAGDSSLSDELRKIHLDYARALQQNRVDLETDSEGAAAALAQKDYASFFAKGVRFGDEKSSGNYEFRRVVQQNTEVVQITNWLQTRTVSVQHALTQTIEPSETARYRPVMGLCDALPTPWQTPILNAWGQVTGFNNDTYLLLTCVQSGGPLSKAGIVPGRILTEIDGQKPPTNLQSLLTLLNSYDPGSVIALKTLQPGPGPMPQFETHTIKLGKGPPLD